MLSLVRSLYVRKDPCPPDPCHMFLLLFGHHFDISPQWINVKCIVFFLGIEPPPPPCAILIPSLSHTHMRFLTHSTNRFGSQNLI